MAIVERLILYRSSVRVITFSSSLYAKLLIFLLGLSWSTQITYSNTGDPTSTSKWVSGSISLHHHRHVQFERNREQGDRRERTYFQYPYGTDGDSLEPTGDDNSWHWSQPVTFMTWDCRWGVQTSLTDENGNTTHTRFHV